MNYNYSALTRPITKEDIAAYKAHGAKKNTGSAVVAIIAIWLLMIAIFVLPQFWSGFSSASTVVIFSLISLAVIGYILARVYRRRRLARLIAFAKDNSASFQYDVWGPRYTGMIFNHGHSQSITEALYFPNDVEIGNYTYQTGSGRSRQSHHWGYIRTKLVRKLPHMVLDAKKNNMFGAISNLPQSLVGAQKLKLEGNFNDFFTLYAPVGYERDAFYVFTPDVMAALIDHGANFDIEVIDNELILYSANYIDIAKADRLKNVLEIIDTISAEVIHQGDYYADSNVANRSLDIIATPGRRLQSRLSIVSIIFFVAIVGYVIWNMFAGFTR